MTTLKDKAINLFKLIEQGKTSEAMEKYYDENVTIQENDAPARTGKLLNLLNENDNIKKVKSIDARLKSYAINEDAEVIFSEWDFRFANLDGSITRLEEVSVQHWANGKIVHERFYYQNFKKM